jgi:hypothetical protein
MHLISSLVGVPKIWNWQKKYCFNSMNLHYWTQWFGRRYRPLLFRPIDQHRFLQETAAAISMFRREKKRSEQKVQLMHRKEFTNRTVIINLTFTIEVLAF